MIGFVIIFLLMLILWPFTGYPFFLFCFSQIRKKEETSLKKHPLPSVSIIIPAYKEEKIIKEKIKNTLELDYPKEKLEIIIVNSTSNDKTPEIVKKIQEQIKNPKIKLINIKKRGKDFAVREGVKYANYSILFITDANCFVEKPALRLMVPHLQPHIGGVIGHFYFKNHSAYVDETLLRKFDWYLYQREAKLGILFTFFGDFYLIRKEILEKLPLFSKGADDFNYGLATIKAGYKIAIEPKAKGYEYLPKNLKDFFSQKRRIIAHSWGSIELFKELLNPFKYGLIAIALWSHKLLILLSPLLVILTLIISGFWFFSVGLSYFSSKFLLGLIVFSLLVGWVVRGFLKSIILYQIVLLIGFWEYFQDKNYLAWEPIASTR